MKILPESFSDFSTIRTQDLVYIDKTEYIQKYEALDSYVSLLLRPRRFGKTMFTEILRYYYDSVLSVEFDEYFEGTWIHSNPTPLRGRYCVLKFDFSGIRNLGGVEDTINFFMSQVSTGIRRFYKTHPEFLPFVSSFRDGERMPLWDVVRFYNDRSEFTSPAMMLSRFLSDFDCLSVDQEMMVIIDEYDKDRKSKKTIGTENKDLYWQIAEQGAIISELPLGTKAQMSNFPRRNRIVSAISSGVLVVEATEHSGSLITAKNALEQGRDIFAVPGSPMDDRSSGPNHLIKDGAYLIENAQDIINVLATANHQAIKTYKNELFSDKFLDNKENNVNIPKEKTAEPKSALLEFLSPEGIHVDELIRMSGLDSAEGSLQLLELEMSGKIERQVGNKVALIKKKR